MMARYNRAEKFLGISSSPVHSTVLDDEHEFKEEDVWDTDAREWPEESSTQDSHTYGGGAGGGGHLSHRSDSNESFRYFTNGRGWMGDQGLSVAFAGDASSGGRARGLSSLSPVKGGSSSSSGHGMSSGRESTPGRIATVSRMIPPTGYQQQQQRETSSRQMMHHHQSAPVNVPDWTKIVGAEKRSVVAWGNEFLDKEKDDDDEEEERLPPHELLAREHANSQATTFSVFEGAGRTLKGRDLSRVRNAVLRKTGFIDF